MPDKLDLALASLRQHVASTETPPDQARDARMRSEVVARIARLKGPQLAAFLDSARILVPDDELDRLLRRSA